MTFWQACCGGSPYTRREAIQDSSRGLSTLTAKTYRMLQGEQCHRSRKKGLFTKLPLEMNRDGRIPACLFGQPSPRLCRTFQETWPWPLNPRRDTAWPLVYPTTCVGQESLNSQVTFSIFRFESQLCEVEFCFLNTSRLLWFIDTCVCAASLQSCLAFGDPMDCSPPGSSVHGILQVRILEWVAVSSFRRSSRSKDWTPISYGSCIGIENKEQHIHIPGDLSPF